MTATFLNKKSVEFVSPEPLCALADTHGHITHFRHTEAAAALVRAAAAGVKLLVVPVDPVDEVAPGKRFKTVEAFAAWLEGVLDAARAQLGPQMLDVRLAIGVHPYGAAELDDAALVRLKALLSHPLAVAVGEFGFDYGPWSEVSTQEQRRAFCQQLRLAHEFGLPVELHLRDPEQGEPLAHIQALELLGELGVPERGCDLHCYTSGPEIMEPFCELGCHIAFGGAATFARSDEIRHAFLACPTELMLTETDSPYMAPVPLRGTECEPGMIAFTAAFLAQLREQELGVAAQKSYQAFWQNAQRFFLSDDANTAASCGTTC